MISQFSRILFSRLLKLLLQTLLAENPASAGYPALAISFGNHPPSGKKKLIGQTLVKLKSICQQIKVLEFCQNKKANIANPHIGGEEFRGL